MDLLLSSPMMVFLVVSTILVHVGAAFLVHRAIKRAAKAEQDEEQ